jgi:putative NADH-flavin reductase
MKLLVLGATGKTGQLVLAAARRVGHDVTVLVRDPARLPSTAGLMVVTGDATSGTDLGRALAGQDAVVSVVGG